MSRNLSATGKGTVTQIISDQSKQLTTRPLINGVEKQHKTTASGFKQSYDIDIEFETVQSIEITGVEMVQSRMSKNDRSFVMSGIQNPYTPVMASNAGVSSLQRDTTTSGKYTVKSKSKVRVRVECVSLNSVDSVHVRPEHND